MPTERGGSEKELIWARECGWAAELNFPDHKETVPGECIQHAEEGETKVTTYTFPLPSLLRLCRLYVVLKEYCALS